MTEGRPHQIKGKVTSATIVRRVDLTREHFKIWLRCAEPLPFEPGQYCTVGVAGVERPYSIVSSPREPLLELFVELIPPPLGHLTPLLYDLKVGDAVTLRPRAKGVFLLRPQFRNHVMVATVTGIAPFVSMLRHWLEGPVDESRMYVLEGASFRDEFGYDEELHALAQRHASVRFVPTCSRPDDPRNVGWQGEVGRVHTIVERYVRDWELQPAETCIYACGHPQMIEDLRGRYAGTGFEFEEERFWKPH
ncbi:MAG TPA: ferredoxin--NADP reductase [Gammaproteobacteria bacterium]|nr:ferredoxin--NADP reductase [Gammaproteobacteria bacterium]